MAFAFVGNENSIKQDVAQYVRDCLKDGDYPTQWSIADRTEEEIRGLALVDRELVHALTNHGPFYMASEIGEYATDVRSALDYVYRETLREELADFTQELADDVEAAMDADEGYTHICPVCEIEADGEGPCPDGHGAMEGLDRERNITSLAALIDVELANWLI